MLSSESYASLRKAQRICVANSWKITVFNACLLQLCSKSFKIAMFGTFCYGWLRFIAFCCGLLRVAAFCYVSLRFDAFCSALLRFAVVCCILLHFAALRCGLLNFAAV